MKNKVLWVDVETTGLYSNKNGLIQIAALFETDGKIQDRFISDVRTFDSDLIDPVALKVTGTTKEEIATFPNPQLVFESFVDFLKKYVNQYDRFDKFIIAGYNIDFDIGFLKAFWKKNHNKFYGSFFNWVPIDVMKEVVSSCIMLDLPIPPRIRLIDMIEHFGLEVPKGLHDAEIDIEMTRKIYKKITELLTKKG